jgi:superfamily I DNA and/or RNA helicase
MQKRGQVTIFIIIAILIVGAAVLVYTLVPKVQTGTGFDANNPSGFIQDCMNDKITQTVKTISSQGGSLNPEFYFLYNEEKIEYLCYTNENYKLCVVQQPLLKPHIESEIKKDISEEVTACFNNLKANYEGEGYAVQLQIGKTKVELLPKRVITTFENYTFTATKGETKMYNSFNVVLNNNLYELISISNSIIEYEATYGNADPRIYMTYYPDLKVEKNLRDDGTRIYTIMDRNTENKFKFASRSVAIPPGY